MERDKDMLLTLSRDGLLRLDGDVIACISQMEANALYCFCEAVLLRIRKKEGTG